MKAKLFGSIATFSLVASTSVASAAEIGSRIDFSGYVFGTSNQLDYIDSSDLTPNPNALGNFQVLDATGSFAPALTNPSQLGEIRDFSAGISLGAITQSGPLFDGSDNPSLYLSDFLSLTIPNLVNFSFELQTLERTVLVDPNSPDPSDPLISSISSTLTGTLTDFITDENQAAVATFAPNVPPNVPISLLNPDTLLGPTVYEGSLQVISVPESTPGAVLVLLGGFCFGIISGKSKS